MQRDTCNSCDSEVIFENRNYKVARIYYIKYNSKRKKGTEGVKAKCTGKLYRPTPETITTQ